MKKLNEILEYIELSGGKCYYVGGSVRDGILGLSVYDFDIEVYNMRFEKLVSILSKYSELIVNEKFYTIKMKAFDKYEFAVPRIETCHGQLHTDFSVRQMSSIDICKASKRRDFTVNAILLSYSDQTHIDCFGGLKDIEDKRLKHITGSFKEDSLRLLRAIRFSSKLGFEIDPNTLKLCIEMVENLDLISSERFVAEFNGFIQGKYFDVGVKYFIAILKDYFKIKDYDLQTLKDINTCKNIKIRKLLFFYHLRNCDISKLINRCINKKSDIKALKLMIKTDFNGTQGFYDLTRVFDEEEIKLMYKYICNENIELKYNKYQELSRKYNASYFIDLGYSGSNISKQISTTIIKELNNDF